MTPEAQRTGRQDVEDAARRGSKRLLSRGLVTVVVATALLFAVSGLTLWLSAAGRFRWRVLGVAVFVGLVQFLINLVGQMWDVLQPLRPFTLFYYYQPQPILLQHRWTVDLAAVWGSGPTVNVLAVLFGAGVAGYAMALWTFCRRDLPAPL